MKNPVKFEITETSSEDGFYKIRLGDGNFAGIEYSYSGVSIGEHPDKSGDGLMTFEYNIHSGGSIATEDKDKFGEIIGDVLLQILEDQLSKEAVVFAGGV